jgi:hypothetical protein
LYHDIPPFIYLEPRRFKVDCNIDLCWGSLCFELVFLVLSYFNYFLSDGSCGNVCASHFNNAFLFRQSDATKAISRPWEVALFALCSSQNPWFKDVVLGPTGVQSLVTALDAMLSRSIPVQDVHWENVALTLRALAFLSEHDWVAKVVEERIVRSLLGVFRCLHREPLNYH